MKTARNKLKGKGSNIITGIAWYSPAQWADLRRVASDPEVIESTYEEWLAVIRRTVPDLIRTGMTLVKVPVDVFELVRWCEERGSRIDQDARAQYVVEALQQRGASSFETIIPPI